MAGTSPAMTGSVIPLTETSSPRSAQRLAGGLVPLQDALPDLRRALGEPEQLTILAVNDAFVDEEIEIDRPAPVVLAHQDDRNRLDLPRLHQREDLEQLVDRAEAARKGDQRLGA